MSDAAANGPGQSHAGGLTAKDIAEIWQLPIGTVYWLANKHRWARSDRSRRVHYSVHDVIAALG